jgi:hypothetical protein
MAYFFLSMASPNMRMSSRHSRTSELFMVSPQPEPACFLYIIPMPEPRRFPTLWSVEETRQRLRASSAIERLQELLLIPAVYIFYSTAQ